MDKFSLARLMGHSSPRVAERYYVHVTERHVTAGFERFSEYVAKKQIDAFPALTDRPQLGSFSVVGQFGDSVSPLNLHALRAAAACSFLRHTRQAPRSWC
jgi:hypothetical protein